MQTAQDHHTMVHEMGARVGSSRVVEMIVAAKVKLNTGMVIPS